MNKNEKKLIKVNRQLSELNRETTPDQFRILSQPLWTRKRKIIAKLNKWNEASAKEVVLIK